ncbi:MAG: HNH endonuclease [Azoarcus sp.]|nr:HNH endonuclease [Azoarcus sp.]
MEYKEFKNDELGFDEWIKSHPFGVVINSKQKGLDPGYIKAHRPGCSSIQRHPGSKTVYSKHCFDSAEEAIQVLAQRGIPKPSFGCMTCKVGVLEPTGDERLLEQRAQTLLRESFSSPPIGNTSPERTAVAQTTSIKRDPAIVAWVQKTANGKCELCLLDAPFLTDENRPYLEVHHVVTLANNGPDTIDNAVALCPNCHRAMHFSNNRIALTERLYVQVPRLARNQ